MGDFEQPKPWNPRAIEGVNRFLVASGDWSRNSDEIPRPATRTLRLRHKTIKRVTNDLEGMQFNTAISALMEYVNEIMKGSATREDLVRWSSCSAPSRRILRMRLGRLSESRDSCFKRRGRNTSPR